MYIYAQLDTAGSTLKRKSGCRLCFLVSPRPAELILLLTNLYIILESTELMVANTTLGEVGKSPLFRGLGTRSRFRNSTNALFPLFRLLASSFGTRRNLGHRKSKCLVWKLLQGPGLQITSSSQGRLRELTCKTHQVDGYWSVLVLGWSKRVVTWLSFRS